MNDLNSFKKIFSWYRALSIALIKEMPEDMLNEQISDRSLPVRCQVIDLGLMQLITAEQKGASISKTMKPDEETPYQEQSINYQGLQKEITSISYREYGV